MADLDEMLKALGQPEPTPPDATAPGSGKIDDMMKSIGQAEPAQPTGYTLGRVAVGTAQNLLTGATKEINDAFWGPIVMAVNHFSPGAAKSLYDKVSKDTPLTRQDPAAPIAAELGHMAGLGAMLGAGGAAGAAVGLGPTVSTALAGGALGGTTLKDPAEEGGRISDALLGAAGAVIGKGVGELATAGVAKLINSWGAQRILGLAKESVEGMAESGNSLRDRVNTTFSDMMKKARGDYRLKDIHGNSIIGQNSMNLGDDLAAFVENNKLTDRVKSVLESATKTIVGADADLPLLKGMKPSMGRDYLKNLQEFLSGKLKGLPTDQFAPSDLLMAYSRVTDEWKSEASRASKAQLGKLRGVLDDEIKRIAAAAGRSPVTLKAQAAQLNKFYKNEVLPFTEYFGVPKNYNPPLTTMSARDFDRSIIKLFESDDPEKFAKILPVIKGHEDHVAKLIMQKALNAGVDGKKFNLQAIAGYFRKREDMVKRMPAEYQDMMKGFMNYVTSKPLKSHLQGHFNNWITGGGVIIGLEHVYMGEPLHGALYAASTVAALATMRQFSRLINNPLGRRFMVAASKLGPDSPKWGQLIERIAPLMAGGAGEEKLRSHPERVGVSSEPEAFDFEKRFR